MSGDVEPVDPEGEPDAAVGATTAAPEFLRPSARRMVPALVVGWLVIGLGVRAALGDELDAHPFALAVHVVGFDLGHDLLVVPLGLLASWLVSRLLPTIVRGPVRAALGASAVFVLFAVPLVNRWGRRPTNSSTLPLPYGRNLAIVLLVVWISAAMCIAWRARPAVRHIRVR